MWVISVRLLVCSLVVKFQAFQFLEWSSYEEARSETRDSMSSALGSLWRCPLPANIHQQTTEWEEFCYLGVLLPSRPRQNHTQITGCLGAVQNPETRQNHENATQYWPKKLFSNFMQTAKVSFDILYMCKGCDMRAPPFSFTNGAMKFHAMSEMLQNLM